MPLRITVIRVIITCVLCRTLSVYKSGIASPDIWEEASSSVYGWDLESSLKRRLPLPPV